MATDAISGADSTRSGGRKPSHAENGLNTILAPIASLRLTVVLFAFSIALVMIGTLAQENESMWDVMEHYFRATFCWVPLQVFFPSSFFPHMKPIAGGFYFPGGRTLGALLIMNLLAAHLVRFKPQSRGTALAAGLGLMALAGGLIAWIVLSAQSINDGSLNPESNWNFVWQVLRWSAVALWAGIVYWVVAVATRQTAMMWTKCVLCVLWGVVAFGLVAYGTQPLLDNASLRILWQLMQGTVVGGVLLAGAWLTFRKRAGVVVIHLGIGLLMLGELLVSIQAVERQMLIREGETCNVVKEPRALEFAVIDRTPAEHDRVVSVPVRPLKPNRRFSNAALPFDIELIKFMKNCNLSPTERLKRAAMQGPQSPDDFAAMRLLLPVELRQPAYTGANLSTTGSGLVVVAEPAETFGAGAQRENEAAAYVRLLPKGDSNAEPITLLLAQRFGDAAMTVAAGGDLTERVSWDGKMYEIALRNRRSLTPFTLTLEDIRKVDYVGTATPKDYSSFVILKDPLRGVEDRHVRIWMNNPLRYAGETIYQLSYHPLPGGEATSLQLVANSSWMLPYVACMLVVVGLICHFLTTLRRFLTRRERDSTSDRQGMGHPSMGDIRVIATAAGIVLLILAPALRPKPAIVDEMKIGEFAKLPIVDQGRVKPLDTLARHVLKTVSNKQSFLDTTLTEPARQPAIKWLLDVITSSEVGDQHRVVSITDPDVIGLLGLTQRKRFLYSMDEFRDQLPALQTEARKAMAYRERHPKDPGRYHRSIIETYQRCLAINRLRDAFEPTPFPPLPTQETRDENPELAEQQLRAFTQLLMQLPERAKRLMATSPPLVIPAEENIASGGQPEWLPFALAADAALAGQIRGQEQVNTATLAWGRMLQAYARGDAQRFNQQLEDYAEGLAASPPPEVHEGRVQFEAHFNAFSPFYWCMALYIVAFVVTSCSWLGWFNALRSLSWWILIFTFVVHTLALAGRIYISGRPPVTNLYSSAVFLGWGIVLISIILEGLFPLSLLNLIAAIAGFATLFIAHNLAGTGDTFTVLQAVLDTQFWLATHVVCITLGYSTTFLAGGLGTIYVLGGIFSRSVNPRNADAISRMTYGIICFAIFFSFFGTVLGGLWADDSWGRFWGWDPKENGALIIVLWNALILHARWGGMIRQRGLAILAIVGNIVTAWSWFGVNELGIGLHAYANFEDSAKKELALYVLSQLLIVGLGCLPIAMWGERVKSNPPSSTTTA